MDLGTHLFIGVVAATSWPALTEEQKILTILFAVLPDSFEWLHELARKHYDNDSHLTVDDYNRLEKKIESHWYMWPYHFFHNIFTPTAFLLLSLIFHWPLVYSLMWLVHILLDLPSHKTKLGVKLWWPFSEKRLHGLFDWWLVGFFRGWEMWGYWAVLAVISTILIRNFWT